MTEPPREGPPGTIRPVSPVALVLLGLVGLVLGWLLRPVSVEVRQERRQHPEAHHGLVRVCREAVEAPRGAAEARVGGALVGGASLKAQDFLAIIRAAN